MSMGVHDTAVLSISASDTMGCSGLQADTKTIGDLGGRALTAVTAVCVEGSLGTQRFHPLPAELVAGQVRSALECGQPQAVKVGYIGSAEAAETVRRLLYAHGGGGKSSPTDPHNGPAADKLPMVLSPGLIDSAGRRIADADTAEALLRLLPLSTIAVMRCGEAALLTGQPVNSDDDMTEAAQALRAAGAEWVMLRGGLQTEGRCTALLAGPDSGRFFASYNVEGWRQHGVGGALAAAIAARLAMGDPVPAAVGSAHDYVHRQVVYAVRPDGRHLRPSDLYNQFLSLLAQHYRDSHDVAFYAERLAITPRYLSGLTNDSVGKPPKQIIADYLTREAKILLETTRLSVQEVTLRLGFPNQAAFSRFFTRQTGRSPAAWR